ncbi:hypothetical protein [uncultured Pontibacter sp.]|uniref:hypothetical protein n=1 Tax=uncultured Pontibacter sp. TaxID=453356 RepID=UPI00260720DC|nr:hypothetical protein [uncultured Pontibacter sp.]
MQEHILEEERVLLYELLGNPVPERFTPHTVSVVVVKYIITFNDSLCKIKFKDVSVVVLTKQRTEVISTYFDVTVERLVLAGDSAQVDEVQEILVLIGMRVEVLTTPSFRLVGMERSPVISYFLTKVKIRRGIQSEVHVWGNFGYISARDTLSLMPFPTSITDSSKVLRPTQLFFLYHSILFFFCLWSYGWASFITAVKVSTDKQFMLPAYQLVQE